MPFDPTKAGWTEKLKSVEEQREEEETPVDRTVSYIALVILATALLGFLVMASPYLMAILDESQNRRHSYSRDPTGQRAEFWIKDDTKAKAGYRFAAGAIAGAALSIGYLVLQSYRNQK